VDTGKQPTSHQKAAMQQLEEAYYCLLCLEPDMGSGSILMARKPINRIDLFFCFSETNARIFSGFCFYDV
jgi:hypothetical protein